MQISAQSSRTIKVSRNMRTSNRGINVSRKNSCNRLQPYLFKWVFSKTIDKTTRRQSTPREYKLHLLYENMAIFLPAYLWEIKECSRQIDTANHPSDEILYILLSYLLKFQPRKMHFQFLISSLYLFLLRIVRLTISCKMSVVAWIKRSFGLKTITADLVNFLPWTEIQGMMTIHIAIHTYILYSFQQAWGKIFSKLSQQYKEVISLIFNEFTPKNSNNYTRSLKIKYSYK